MKKTYIPVGAWLLALLLTLGACSGDSLPPNDPLYPAQTNLSALHMETAWAAGMTGQGVRIAVIDTGVAGHPDLNARRITSRSYVDEDGSDLTDRVGHGTFIAGLLAATRNNGKGIAGMTDSHLVILKVWNDDGQVRISALAQAIRDAVDAYGCGVINISMGTPNDSAELREAVSYAASQGAILVASAGGGSGAPIYPAAYEGVVGVDALNEAGDLHNSACVAAPGEGLVGLSINGGYIRDGAGSSYAAAQVSALAAIAKQQRPDLTGEDFITLLDADRGAVDAARLVEALQARD